MQDFSVFTILKIIMPTYEYECKSCGHGFEIFQAMSDPPLKNCPECGKEVRRLIFGGTGVIFKGSGFYVTDKSKGGKSENKPAVSRKTDVASSADSSPAASDTSKGSSEKVKPETKSA